MLCSGLMRREKGFWFCQKPGQGVQPNVFMLHDLERLCNQGCLSLRGAGRLCGWLSVLPKGSLSGFTRHYARCKKT